MDLLSAAEVLSCSRAEREIALLGATDASEGLESQQTTPLRTKVVLSWRRKAVGNAFEGNCEEEEDEDLRYSASNLGAENVDGSAIVAREP